MSTPERPVCFECRGETLVGILHPSNAASRIGVVIVVGGPQYRIGSHRHFVELARDLAASGIPVLRFDVRGMGDSSGTFPGFEAIDDDIEAAVNLFIREDPRIEEIVLWGLCDGASASMFYAPRDPRVTGLVLLNPWIRSETSYAQAELRHYYVSKILDRAFWGRLMSGGVDLGDAATSLMKRVRTAFMSAKPPAEAADGGQDQPCTTPLSERMARGLSAFDGKVLLIISGNDLTAREFDDVTGRAAEWKGLLAADRISRRDLKNSDHTFSREEWSGAVNRWTVEWVKGLAVTAAYDAA